MSTVRLVSPKKYVLIAPMHHMSIMELVFRATFRSLVALTAKTHPFACSATHLLITSTLSMQTAWIATPIYRIAPTVRSLQPVYNVTLDMV